MTLREFIDAEKDKLDSFWTKRLLQHAEDKEQYPLDLNREQWLEEYLLYIVRTNMG